MPYSQKDRRDLAVAAAAIAGACAKLNFQVPDEVAVIGCNDDVTFCHTATPPLSSVKYPGREIGLTAALMLSRLMMGKSQVPMMTEVLPTQVVTRESTDILAFNDPIIAEAIRSIRREAPTSPLQVGDLVQRLPISRAAFQKRFRSVIGCSPKEEITRVRSERLCELLATTDWTVKEIAFQMRFGSSEELSRFLRRTINTTATDYRKSKRRLSKELRIGRSGWGDSH